MHLQRLQNHQFAFSKLLQDQGDMSEFKLIQEQFSVMKQAFLSLEAKQCVMDAMESDQHFVESTDVDKIEILEQEIKESKAQITQVKRGSEAMKAQLRRVITNLREQMQRLNASRLAFMTEYNKENQQKFRINKNELVNINATSNLLGKTDDANLSLDTEDRCKAVIAAQERAMNTLSAEVASIEASIQQIQNRNAATEALIASEKAKLASLKASRGESAPQVQSLENERNWYLAVTKLMSTLGGFEVDVSQMTASKTMRIRFKPLDMPPRPFDKSSTIRKSKEGVLIVKYNDSGDKFVKAEFFVKDEDRARIQQQQQQQHGPSSMLSSSSSFTPLQSVTAVTSVTLARPGYVGIDVRDVAIYAVEQQDLPLLVREVQRRLLRM